MMAATHSDTLARLFTEARSQNGWRSDPVEEGDLRDAYDLARWAPTSMNGQPMRLIFLRSAEAKARLQPALLPGNVEKAMNAPVLAIIAYDTDFHVHLPNMFPHNPGAQALFEANQALREETAFRNGTLQAAYFMLALRASGFDVGPISGFNAAAIDKEFFDGTTCRTNFLCGIGQGDPSKVFDRLPRFSYDVVAQTL
nr:malonic semialdehyde reductase [Sphingomonas sp. CDS-1]